MHIYNPLYQECPRRILNLCLYFLQVIYWYHLKPLLLPHIPIYILSNLGLILYIIILNLVMEAHIRQLIILKGFKTLVEYLGDRAGVVAVRGEVVVVGGLLG